MQETKAPQSPPSQAITLLKNDHMRLVSLFLRCEAGIRSNDTAYLQLLPELFHTVRTHGQLEQEFVYPLVRQYMYASNDLLLMEFEETHADSDELIDQIHGLSRTDSAVAFLLEELIDNMRIHIDEEETSLFPALLQLPPHSLEQLAHDVQQRLAPRA